MATFPQFYDETGDTFKGYAKNYSFYSITNGAGTWKCPIGVPWVHVYLIGAGGSGGPATTDGTWTYNAIAGGGGGGGQAALTKDLAVTQGTTYNYVVGAGAVDNTGGQSSFDSTTVIAKGGGIGQPADSNFGPQAGLGGNGSITGSVGDSTFVGGDGGAAVVSAINNEKPGGGGGAGGSEGNGNAGSGTTGGAGVQENVGTGNGANGLNPGVGNGTTGSTSGGGGSGGATNIDLGSSRSGGRGGHGEIRLQWPTTHLMFL